MSDWYHIDLSGLFTFQRAPLETVVRSTLAYLLICVLLRIVPKRQAGKLSPNDLIVVVLIGGVATTAVELSPMSIADVFVVMVTISLLSYLVDWLAYRFPGLRLMVQEPPTTLIRNGRFLRRNLERELVTEEEVAAQLRMQGLHDIAHIKQACLEADGTISVLRHDPGQNGDVTKTRCTD